MEVYENELLDETMRAFVNSGHAFVVFDSVASLNLILKHFKTTPWQGVRIFFLSIKEKIFHFGRWISGRDNASQHQLFDSRGRSKSNFLGGVEGFDQDFDYDDQTKILIARKASEPLDILWKNMGVISSHFPFTRFFLFIISIVLIIFLSSPAVMVAHLTEFDSLSWLSFGWAEDEGYIGKILKRSGPSSVVIVVNTIIIVLLDYAALIESYDCHSAYQNTVYMKTVIYTNLNMFIIPVITMSSGGSSLYDLFITNNFNFAKLLGGLFIPKSGEFFILLLVQQGVLSAMYYGLNLPDIIWNRMSGSLAHERRKIFNDQAPWRRDE